MENCIHGVVMTMANWEELPQHIKKIQLKFRNNKYSALNFFNYSYLENSWLSSVSSLKIQDFSCGDYYAGAITAEGHLYTWGFGNVRFSN